MFGTCALAQNSIESIERRIESTFDLVMGNSAELAIPLTRRALARRSVENNETAVAPLPYAPAPVVDDSAPVTTASVSGGEDEAAPAEDPDQEVARLPRPRPRDAGEEVDPAASAPLDLVAGAAEPVPETIAATPAVPPPQTVAATLAVAPPQSAADEPILGAAATGAPAPELVASSACLSPRKVSDADGDFKRNADVLSSNAFCIAEEKFKERRRDWVVQTITTRRAGPLWAVMHDDEDMSFDEAVEALKTYGGTLVAVDTGGKRNRDGIDPNRNFSGDGIGCPKLGTDSAPHYTAFFRGLLSDQPIIALHNDTDGEVPTGGLGHLTMKDVPKDMVAVPATGSDKSLGGDRNLVLLVSGEPVSATAARRADALSAKGINVIIEKVGGQGDCSLSNFALQTGHPDYLNVTVDHGERDVQRKIIDIMLAGRSETVATQ